MIKKHTISFKHAIDGIIHTFKSQPNLRIHCMFAVGVVILGGVLKISHIEWVVLAFTITLVITAEMINTSVEAMVDLLTSSYDLNAKIAKDVSAGMVLISAIGSVVVGAIIFIPYLW